MRRVLLIILTVTIIFSQYSFLTFALNTDKENSVLYEGECGLSQADNIKYKYYDNGVMKISGVGIIGQIVIPEYYNELWCIEIEEGIAGIADNAFLIKDVERCKLCKIKLPISIKYLGENVIPKEKTPYHKVAICFAGSEEQWGKIDFDGSSNPHISFNEDNCISYYENKEPKPFIKIECESKDMVFESGEQIKVFISYYLGEQQDSVIIVEKSNKSLNSFHQTFDLRIVGNCFSLSSVYSEKCSIKAYLVSEKSDTLLDSDSMNIAIKGPGFKDIYNRVNNFIHIDSVYIAFSGLSILGGAIIAPFLMVLSIGDRIKGLFKGIV